MRLTGVFVALALLAAAGSVVGQPTRDVSELEEFFYHWRDGRDLPERMATAFERLLRQQEQHQQQQGERMERLAQMLSESVEGRRRLEMQVNQLQQQQQQLGDQVDQLTRYVSPHRHQHQLFAISSLMGNVTGKLEASISAGVSTIVDTVDSIRRRPEEENMPRTLAMMEEVRNLTTRLLDEQRSVPKAYDEKRQNQSADQLEIMITESMAVIRQDLGQIRDAIRETSATKMRNTAVANALSDIAANASQNIAEIDDKFEALRELSLRSAEFSHGRFESMMRVGNASLDELRHVAHQLRAQQQLQQAGVDTILDKMVELTNSTEQSRLPLLEQYKQIENSISENVSRVLVMLSEGQEHREAVVVYCSG